MRKEKYFSAAISIIMYSVLPLIAFAAWVIGIPILLYGGLIASVDDAQGLFQTLFVFSFPMFLFFVIIPIFLQKRKHMSMECIGVKWKNDRKNICILLVNICILAVCLGRLIVLYNNWSEVLPMIIQLCVIGISEEVLCRGIIYGEVHKATEKTWMAIIVSTFIFAFLFHSGDSDAANLFVRFPLGLIFALLRHYTGNVYSGAVMHTWYNTLMLII